MNLHVLRSETFHGKLWSVVLCIAYEEAPYLGRMRFEWRERNEDENEDEDEDV